MQDHKTEIAGNLHILQIITRQLFNFAWHESIRQRDVAPLELQVSGSNSITRGSKLVPVHIIRGNIAYHRLGCLRQHQHIIAAHGHGQFKSGGSGQLF